MSLEWQWRPGEAAAARLIDLAQQAACQEPNRVQNWVSLSNFLTMLEGQRSGLNALLEGIEHCPKDADLRYLAAQRLRALADYERAVEMCEETLELNPEHGDARLLRLSLLIKLGRSDVVECMMAETAEVDASATGILDHLAAHLDEDGVAIDILRRCELALAKSPPSANAAYYKALALVKLGDVTGAKEALALNRYVRTEVLPIPAAFPSAEAFRAKLADEILAHPSLRPDPRGKSTSGGRQTEVLREEDGLAVGAAFQLFRNAVDRFADSLGEDRGPFAESRPTKCSLQAWAVVQGPGGRQQSHRHPDGWLSGVYYVRSQKSDQNRNAGDLLLGSLDESVGVSPSWGIRRIEPVPGRLVLFPSYVPHSTEPNRSTGERISVAFDVIPIT